MQVSPDLERIRELREECAAQQARLTEPPGPTWKPLKSVRPPKSEGARAPPGDPAAAAPAAAAASAGLGLSICLASG